MSLVDGVFTGLVIGTVLSLPAFIAELLHHRENLPLIPDVKEIWGHNVPAGNVLAWSTLLYLLLSSAYGGIYVLVADFLPLTPYSLLSIGVYSSVFLIIFLFIVAPLLGFGFSYRREGRWVWFELLISHLLFALAYFYAATRFVIG